MSFATWNFLKVYARWRESFLSAHPEKRLFPERPEGSETSAPFITLGEKGKKIGLVVLALVAILLLSESRNS